MTLYHIECADCLTGIAAFPDQCIDALVTDPPAGISFMGKEWDGDKGGRAEWVAWMTGVMKDVHRVLKPGAHGLVWALPRTSHWTATALEDAGFEIRDIVTHHFGTGFPKSLDVSKAIDREAGAERLVIGARPIAYVDSPSGYSSTSQNSTARGGGIWNPVTGETEYGRPITAPATDAAKQWSGWGTALKPATEHWILVRKPLEGTVAQNVQRWGTGAINIDASRIATQDNLNGGAYSGEERRREDHSPSDQHASATLTRLRRGVGEFEQPSGRWPANVAFTHSEDCDADASDGDGAGAGACAAGCPVAALDAQSGDRPVSGQAKLGKQLPGVSRAGFMSGQTRTSHLHNDSGGASRFFYVAKSSRSERGAENKHPTVKALALMEWLIRLITPPKGIVLDPFMGSGSTGAAALRIGFRFVGFEREPAYFEVASTRVSAAAG